MTYRIIELRGPRNDNRYQPLLRRAPPYVCPKHNTDADPEVPERAKGPRRFPAAYKAKILAEYESLPRAAKGALLVAENLCVTGYI